MCLSCRLRKRRDKEQQTHHQSVFAFLLLVLVVVRVVMSLCLCPWLCGFVGLLVCVPICVCACETITEQNTPPLLPCRRYVMQGNLDGVSDNDRQRQVAAARYLLADTVQGIMEAEPNFLPQANINRLMTWLSIEPRDVSFQPNPFHQ